MAVNLDKCAQLQDALAQTLGVDVERATQAFAERLFALS